MKRKQKRDRFIINLELFQLKQELTDTEFAEILNKKRQNWCKWKNGERGISLVSMREITHRIDKHYNKKETWTITDFLREDGPPEVKKEKRK
jgi:hypothetical protein